MTLADFISGWKADAFRRAAGDDDGWEDCMDELRALPYSRTSHVAARRPVEGTL